ncbi:MAG: glycogen debranching enzyme family protein [Clostridia bacterium]|nr:glycogen debranching enzyme family protein [Clostridia bacterium]
MRFVYGRQDMSTLARAQENCYLFANGLGGYTALSAAFSMSRGDHGLLVAARTAPNDRVNLVARLSESLTCGKQKTFLSTQKFADGRRAENGYRHLSSLTVDDTPRWVYDVRGVRVTREVAIAREQNAVAVLYTIENRTATACTLQVRPCLLGFEKGHAPLQPWDISMDGQRITTNGHAVYVTTSGTLAREAPRFEQNFYMHDAPDGRPPKGLTGSVCSIRTLVPGGETQTLAIVLADHDRAPSADAIIAAQKQHMQALRDACPLRDPVAQHLVCAADAYIARRESTGGKTILAGYPFFGDWGRDTMIALTGCTLSTNRYDDAKSILRTFLQYEKDGLVPNMFPEGNQAPYYNTVDAALLLINVVYLYVQRSGDRAFLQEALPVMERIIAAYQRGTHHGIYMDADGLICAGQGLDQVTWMDVRIGDILPTPRHGKPVEINAYWYSALMIMTELTGDAAYAALARQVKESFLSAFWMEDKHCLKDVISGTAADGQIRCNQVWAVTMPFTMLSPQQERSVVDTVYAHLYTPCGLRTLSPEDKQYHGIYRGEQYLRDMAYHQGTAWVFPLGAYYLAYLKVHGRTKAAARAVREMLQPMEAALREGCIGQLPEIYDGDAPSFSRGCFAQAWSVGEILRVYDELEAIERS